MNVLDLLTFINKHPDIIDTVTNFKDAVGASTTKEQQIFISENYATLVPFMQSEHGQVAIELFVDEWQRFKTV